MNRRHSIMLLAAVVLAVGTMSFVTGRLMASRRQSESGPVGWLHSAPAQVQQAERRFEQNVQQLTETVTAHKSDLAVMLADPCSIDAEILAQVHRVLESNMRLMGEVGGHLVRLRNSLPSPQRQRLMKSCMASLQDRVQRRYRWRGGAQDDAGRQGRSGGGYGRGRGGDGFGAGRGRQYRGGRGGSDGPADKLQLTAEQMAFARQHDPNFSADCARLKDEVVAAYASLLAGFEDAQTSNDELLLRLEGLIEAHNRLELRVARYVVVIRPQLSAPQRQRLAGLSRGRSRYRGGRSRSNDVGSVGLLGAGGFFGQIVGDSIWASDAAKRVDGGGPARYITTALILRP